MELRLRLVEPEIVESKTSEAGLVGTVAAAGAFAEQGEELGVAVEGLGTDGFAEPVGVVVVVDVVSVVAVVGAATAAAVAVAAVAAVAAAAVVVVVVVDTRVQGSWNTNVGSTPVLTYGTNDHVRVWTPNSCWCWSR